MSTSLMQVQPVGIACACAANHRPIPVLLEQHHIWPQEFNGPTVPENLVWICATTHNTVHVYLRIFLAANGVLVRSKLRTALVAKGYPTEVSSYAVELAHMGFQRIKDGAITLTNTWQPHR